jgi:hypothetical protein
MTKRDRLMRDLELKARRATTHRQVIDLIARAYTAGRAHGIEEAAELADSHQACGRAECDYAPKAIAVAIRALIDEGGE